MSTINGKKAGKLRVAATSAPTAPEQRSDNEVLAYIGNGIRNLSLELHVGGRVHPRIAAAHGLRERTAVGTNPREATVAEIAALQQAVVEATRLALDQQHQLDPLEILKAAISSALRAHVAPPVVPPASPTRRVQALDSKWQLACCALSCHHDSWVLASDQWSPRTAMVCHAKAAIHVFRTPPQSKRVLVASLMGAHVRADTSRE